MWRLCADICFHLLCMNTREHDCWVSWWLYALLLCEASNLSSKMPVSFASPPAMNEVPLGARSQHLPLVLSVLGVGTEVVKWMYFVLVSVSLVVYDVEYILWCLFVICISSLVSLYQGIDSSYKSRGFPFYIFLFVSLYLILFFCVYVCVSLCLIVSDSSLSVCVSERMPTPVCAHGD